MNRVPTLSLSRLAQAARIPATQFLFSGRGPLRRVQIEALRYRTQLLVTGRQGSDAVEPALRA